MNNTLKKLLKFRIILFIFFLIISIMVINPDLSGGDGVIIKSIELNSSAAYAGMNYDPNAQPRNKEIILNVNGKTITTLEDYAKAISLLSINETVRIQTDKREYVMLGGDHLGITVGEKAGSNLRMGLELQGGTRVLLKPEMKITDTEIDDLMAVMENRLNVYGLSDVKVKSSSDMFGNKYIVVEIAGATKDEVKDLIGSQGKFEAKVGNDTVFTGGKEDITHVCRNDGTCAGIRDCNEVNQGYGCKFIFTIKLSGKAAQAQADATSKLEVNITEAGNYLSKPLDLYVDNELVDSLMIGEDLKGNANALDIQISGPGVGSTQEEAINAALKNMNKLQTILITGSLPTKLEIVKMDSISPSLGKAFTDNALKTGLIALIVVGLVVFIKYRRIKIAIPMMFISVSEIIITIGMAALFKFNMDLAAIAGVIAAVGTGIDDQIVIVDEITRKKKGGEDSEYSRNWKEKIKNAFFIIMSTYALIVVSMLPLFWAGAGLLVGFAFTTILGITIGVLITRPAFGQIMEVFLEE
jgi:preprotein translocase subunit SecD